MKKSGFAILTCAVLLSTASGCDAQERPHIDGRFSDWSGISPAHADPIGDGGSSGLDFGIVRIINDENWLYLMFQTGSESVLQDINSLRLLIDTDADASTGMRFGDIGAELLWDFGERQGRFSTASGNRTVYHSDISLFPAPSVSSTSFEIAISRTANPSGEALFPGDRIRVALVDTSPNGDRQPDSGPGISYSFERISYPQIEAIPVSKPSVPGSIRLLSWNVLFGGPLDGSRKSSFTSILRALNPDIMCFQEFFDQGAEEVRAYIASVLVPPSGKTWKARKIDSGNILVTYYEVERSWQVQSGYRESAFLLSGDSIPGGRLLVFNNHLRCCDANRERQNEADGLIAFIRDAKSPGGQVSIPSGTPMILAGDFNLVGDHRQLETMLSGDISDNSRYGPDTAPDWDGSPLETAAPRHLQSLFTYTWRDNGSSFAPGKLDYILYSGSRIRPLRTFIFNSAELKESDRILYGIPSGASSVASDHLPLVLDFYPGTSTGTGAIPVRAESVFSVFPNPFSDRFSISVDADAPANLQVRVLDILGRDIFRSSRIVSSPGRHSIPVGPLSAAPGTYRIVITSENSNVVFRGIKQR